MSSKGNILVIDDRSLEITIFMQLCETHMHGYVFGGSGEAWEQASAGACICPSLHEVFESRVQPRNSLGLFDSSASKI